MKLLFLTETNLRDRLFIKDLVHNSDSLEKGILIHEAFGGSVPDTRFVTKRLSALFSEAMVYNNGFSADQRDLFHRVEGKLHLNEPLVHALLNPIQLLIIGPVMKEDGLPTLADPLEMIALARQQLAITEVVVFTGNPLSPLANKKPLVDTSKDRDHWLGIYEEETPAIHLAHRLRPARLASPVNYAQ